MNDLFGGLKPSSPPPELRAHVLAAAREAAGRPVPGLLELLLADRAVRVSFAIVSVLLVAHLIVDREPGTAPRSTAPVVPDEASVPAETGFTAAEQIDELEPAL